MSSLDHLLNKGAMVEHLSKVADHLEQHEWNRGKLSVGSGKTHSHCLLGAHYCVPLPVRINAMDFTYGMGFESIHEMTIWNDLQPDKTSVIDRVRRKALAFAEST